MKVTPHTAPIVVAYQLLAQRDHTTGELTQKLAARGYESTAIAECITRCQHEKLLNDTRFAENFTWQRVQRGYGPLRIQMDLRAKLIPDEFIQQALAQYVEDWPMVIMRIYHRRYGKSKIYTQAELIKQVHFLRSRGFLLADILAVIPKAGKELHCDDD